MGKDGLYGHGSLIRKLWWNLVLKHKILLSERQFTQLQEINWLEQKYNLILLGPPGVGKTHLSIGLGIEAINKGYLFNL